MGQSSTKSPNTGFDLSDFAAAALRFQSDTKELLTKDNKGFFDDNGLSYTDQKKQEDDALARLLDEQIGLDTDKVAADDEDEELPDWADEGDVLPSSDKDKDIKIISADSKIKTNFLLQVWLYICH